MDYKHIKTTKFSMIVYENIFNYEEQKSILKECLFLCDNDRIKEKTLENIYWDNTISIYLKMFKRPFEWLNLKELADVDENIRTFNNIRTSTTSINHNKELPINKDSNYTYLYFLGHSNYQSKLYINDVDIEIKNNTGVLLPSWVDYKLENDNGIYCFITNFK